MSAAVLDLSTRRIKIYASAFDAQARADLDEHVADTANPHAVTKAQVGLANADNTSDAAKPISDAQAAALAGKAPLSSPDLTGTPTAPTAVLGTVSPQIATTQFVQAAVNVVANDVDNVSVDLDDHLADTTNPHQVTKAQVGLSNADNTADTVKPVSVPQQTAINVASTAAAGAQADIDAHELNLANPHGTTKAQVGLAAVDNTADLAKPISTATQTALNTVTASVTTVDGRVTAHQADHVNPHGVTKAQLGLDSVDNTADAAKPVSGPQQTAINAVAASATAAQVDIDAHEANTANPHGVTKSQVGLGNVDNTSDLAKPISTATQSALNLMTAYVQPHIDSTSNPHGVTQAQVGLGAVDNTSDVAKPVSTATAAALATKAPLASPALTGTPTAPTAPPDTATTQVATTAFVAAAAAEALNAGTPPRPGDTVEAFGETKTGPASAVAPIDPAWVTDTPAGAVIRVDSGVATSRAQAVDTSSDNMVTTQLNSPVLTDEGSLTQTIATRSAFPVEAGHLYQIRWKVQRQVDPIDPLNDAVVLGIQWLDYQKGPVGSSTIATLALTMVDGVVEHRVLAALPPQAMADILAPAGAVYFRPFVDLYGDSGVTDIIVLEAQDVTGLAVINGPLVLPLLPADPVAGPGAGLIAIYAIRNPDTSATLRMQAGTDPVPLDIIVNVGSGG